MPCGPGGQCHHRGGARQGRRACARAALGCLAWLALACASGGAAPNAVNTARPVVLNAAQIEGGVFKDFEPLVEMHEHGDASWKTEDVEAFVSSDRKFDAGMYRSGAVHAEIDAPYGVDEFMYFIEGGVTLTSVDGSQLEVRAGDAVMIPKEWQGLWDTQGYLKIYVIHYPQPLE
jgi:uncharacterized cupin superfamily protein